jgi:hypothetical protein
LETPGIPRLVTTLMKYDTKGALSTMRMAHRVFALAAALLTLALAPLTPASAQGDAYAWPYTWQGSVYAVSLPSGKSATLRVERAWPVSNWHTAYWEGTLYVRDSRHNLYRLPCTGYARQDEYCYFYCGSTSSLYFTASFSHGSTAMQGQVTDRRTGRSGNWRAGLAYSTLPYN